MKGKLKSGVAAALGRLLDAAREVLPTPDPALRPVPIPVRPRPKWRG